MENDRLVIVDPMVCRLPTSDNRTDLCISKWCVLVSERVKTHAPRAVKLHDSSVLTHLFCFKTLLHLVMIKHSDAPPMKSVYLNSVQQCVQL